MIVHDLGFKVKSCRPIDKRLDRKVLRSIDKLLGTKVLAMMFVAIVVLNDNYSSTGDYTVILINRITVLIHQNTLHLTQRFGKTSFKESMTNAALLRNKGTKKSKTGTYYLNKCILFGTMYI